MIYVDETEPDVENEAPFEPRSVKLRIQTEPTSIYSFQNELGRGKFGIVYRCVEAATGRKLAAKYVDAKNKADKEAVNHEVEIMRLLQHPRLLQLYDAFDLGSQMCLILELVEGGELFERVIDDEFILTEKACSIFIKQICEGVEFMHSKQIVHLDLKPENVLVLSKTGNRIKLIDFGFARKCTPDLKVLFGTAEFAAPEVVSFEQVGFTTDCWSIGVITYVLLSGLSPFAGDSDLETMANVTTADYDFDDEAFDPISDQAKEFIAKLLIKGKEKRMTTTQCLQHPWIAGRICKEEMLNKAKLKKFVVRRRWQKAIHAISALRRMGAQF